MTYVPKVRFILPSTVAAMALLTLTSFAVEIPTPLPDPDNKASATNKPIKVYILSGQSNMVGIGQISGGGVRWGSEFLEPVVSVYAGKYDPNADYDTLKPIKSTKLESFGGVKPTPYPGGGTQVVRGFIQPKTTGVYEFRPGYGGSMHNIMQVNGVEVYRKPVGEEAEYTTIKLKANEKVPFEITYLTDQASGLGWWLRTDIPGTLQTVVKEEGKFPYLVDDDGKWTVREDVLYRGEVTATGKGPLTPGVQGNTIGPELGFGYVMGYVHDEPVLIIKSSQGNRSLSWDFLPPGSKQFEHEGKVYAGYKESPSSWDKGTEPKPINWYAGKQYDDCFSAVHRVLDNFETEYPQYKDQGYEIAGFVWWQGHKDGGSDVHAGRYEQNLVHLIKTLRKEFKAPDAPFVIATIGFDGWEMSGNQLIIANAQLAVSGDKGKYPDFKGNVKTVETRDFWPEVENSPRNQGFHYHGNAGTYMQVGEALGRAMAELKSKDE